MWWRTQEIALAKETKCQGVCEVLAQHQCCFSISNSRMKEWKWGPNALGYLHSENPTSHRSNMTSFFWYNLLTINTRSMNNITFIKNTLTIGVFIGVPMSRVFFIRSCLCICCQDSIQLLLTLVTWSKMMKLCFRQTNACLFVCS